MSNPVQKVDEKEPKKETSAGLQEITKGFGELTVRESAETAAVAVEAAARAEVESAYKLALLKPRNEFDARTRIIQACLSPSFAKTAKYRKPIGQKQDDRGNWIPNHVIGPSIRFAEEALRCWRNILIQQNAIYDDDLRRIVKIAVRDLESNLHYTKEVTLGKHVERKKLPHDRDFLGTRTTSTGHKVFIVKTTEDELLIKESANASKVIRTNGLRLIPQHIIADAMAQVDATLTKKITDDPDAERKALFDGFMRYGITPIDIEKHLATPAAQLTIKQMLELREVLTSIEDGHTSWQEYISSENKDELEEKSQPETKGQAIIEKLKDQEMTTTTVAGQTAASETGPPPSFTEEAVAAIRQQQASTQPSEPAAPDVTEVAFSQLVTAFKEQHPKEYGVLLGQLKVRLVGQQQVWTIVPKEQWPFITSYIEKVKEKK